MAVADNITDTVQDTDDDLAEIEAFIREHQRMIFALCYRMTGSVQDAEDLAQETFIQACRSYGSFRGQARVSSWLYRIAINLCLNWQAQGKRVERLHRAFSENLSDSEASEAGYAQQVREALLKLNSKQRAAVVLTTYDGLNHAEAAQVLGCSETTVSWRLFMARRLLRKWLKNLSPGGAHD
jgi:RNA polymerase sigma-70 factor, ECF subfamily